MRFAYYAVVLVFLFSCTTSPTFQAGAGAERSHDGLARVNDSRLDSAWIRPGADLSSYDSVVLVSAGVSYRSVQEVNRLRISDARIFPMDERQKALVEEAVRESFLPVLRSSERFRVVEESGPNTLALTGRLIDVVSYVPPDSVTRVDYYLAQLGAATLVLELYDSMSGQILARGTDARSIDVDSVDRATRVSNRFELNRELDQWADSVRDTMDRLLSLPILPAE